MINYSIDTMTDNNDVRYLDDNNVSDKPWLTNPLAPW